MINLYYFVSFRLRFVSYFTGTRHIRHQNVEKIKA